MMETKNDEKDIMSIQDDESFLYDKKMKCSCCESEFTSKKIKASKLRLVKKDDLLINHYKDIIPLRYTILVCPVCGYAAPENRFTQLKPAEVNIIYQNISSKWKSRDLGGIRDNQQAIQAYKLALIQGSLLNYSNLALGKICLSLGCLSDEDKERKRFLRIARDKYEIAYNTEDLSRVNANELELSYQIAELSHEIDDLETANKWFVTCIQSPGMRSNYMLNELAREKWQIVKNKIAEQVEM